MPMNRHHIMRDAVCACPQAVRACARTAAFTLLELLIVIGIIAVLAAVLISQFGGATESARAAECLAHMRTLANSVQNYCMANNYYPCAGEVEYMTDDMRYRRHKGYIGRYSASGDPYARRNGAASHQSLQTVSTYCKDDLQSKYCVTNGALWTYGSHNLDEYVCPSHKRATWAANMSGPAWSYVMNPYFGYDYSNGSETTGLPNPDIKYGHCQRPDKRLLFAELQWVEGATGIAPPLEESPDTKVDGVLQYDRSDWSGTKEAIGFNHKAGTRYVAHVCFADGHTEKLALAGNGSSAQLIELTKWLCDSDDIELSGGQWRRTHKASDED